METSVLVDNGETAKDWRLSYGSDFHFGLIDKNSLTYFGGMPTAMKANLHGMALPSAAFEPEFKGHIRNVIYGNCSCELVRAQYITGEGVSRPQDEACERRDPCGKGCICVSTDDGPTCDCSREECVQGRQTFSLYYFQCSILFYYMSLLILCCDWSDQGHMTTLQK